MDAQVEFSDFVKFPLKCFKAFGLVPVDDGENGSLSRKFLAIFLRFVLANLTINLLLMSIFVVQNISDLALITEPVPTVGYIAIAIVKAVSVMLNKTEFKDLMETLNELFPISKDQQKEFEVMNYFKSYRRIERFLTFLHYLVGISFATVPFMKLISSGVWINKLPYDNWFPFNEYDPKFYTLILLWEVFCSVVTLASLMGGDLILLSFVTLISMQFDILCHRMHQLKSVESNEAYKRLIELIKLHETMLRLSENLDKIFTFPIFINIFGSSIFICLNVYQASVGLNSTNFVKFTNLIIASMLQIFLLCFYGNKLTNASENVTNAAYSSGWNIQGRNHKLPLLMIVQRSQKPTVLSALKFSDVSLRTFTTILSWAYSYLTLLRTVNSN